MDYNAFMRSELERFLDAYYSFDNVRELLDIDENKYPHVRSATSNGISRGVQNYLTRRERELGNTIPVIYLDDVGVFAHSSDLEAHIAREVHATGFELDNVEAYACDVRQTYGMFVCNESMQRFRCTFRLPE